MSRRLLAIATLAALLPAARNVAAAPRAFPSHEVGIDVAVVDATTARVTETYRLDGAASETEFELLEDPCSTVGPIAATTGDRALTSDLSHRGPWTMVRVAGRADASIELRYDVRLEGDDAAVPIALPAATLETAGEERSADITLHVRFAGALANGSVLLPRLDRTNSDAEWDARLRAIPSVVRLRLPGRPACSRRLPGTTGGLEWRFWIFVATMGAWIPIYFWWFGRRDDSG